MGTYRIHIEASRSAVRAMDAAHRLPSFGGLGSPARWAEKQEQPAQEPPVR